MRSTLISTTVLTCVLLAGASVAHAQTYEKLYSFTAGFTDGASPFAGLVQTADGLFYGTTLSGGANFCGTIFVTDGVTQPTILHSFIGDTEGCHPTGGLLLAFDGNFYGLTNERGQYFGGTMYKMSPAGDFTILHHFNSAVEGANPQFGLIEGNDGAFYGTTSGGGAFSAGTAFRANMFGRISVLHSFGDGPSDGQFPSSPLIQAADGTFFGTTFGGGNPNPPDC